MEHIERIVWNDEPLACIVRAALILDKTTFLTPPDARQQVGYLTYPKGATVPRHLHKAMKRSIVGTSEMIIVKKGRCTIDIYNNDRELVASRELLPGDMMLMLGGGHGYRMLEDTVLFEVKQGPYMGEDEKERF